MSPEMQENLAAAPEVTEGHIQSAKHESAPPHQASRPAAHGDACAQDTTAVSNNLDEKPIKQEAHMPPMVTGSGDPDMASCGSAASISSSADVALEQALKPTGKPNMPVVVTPATEGENQMNKPVDVGQKSSDNIAWRQKVMEEHFDHLTNEEAEIQQRMGTPSEKPIDKTRLPIVKQQIERTEAMLGQNEFLEDIDIAEEMKFAQQAIGLPVAALGATPSVKPASSARKSATSKAKKRKSPPGDTGDVEKKRKVNRASNPEAKAADAVSKLLFSRCDGRSVGSNKNLGETLASMKGLGKLRNGYLKELRAAAAKITTKENQASIDADIRSVLGMTKAFPKCTLKKLLRDRDSEDIGIDDYAWLIEGMASALYHHQLVASGIMCTMERSDTCHGGLLFDYMGYGKTVEALALVVGNKPLDVRKKTRDSGAATTLVVVPSAAAQQWVQEVKRHCPDLDVTSWTKQFELRSLLRADILVITYVELRLVYKKTASIEKRKKKTRQADDKEDDLILDHPLFKTMFHRIILDEVHEIKGYTNITYDSVMALKAKHRWGLTGTPTPNGIVELFPYLKFIRHPKVSSLREFKRTYIGGKGRNALSKDERSERLSELLRPVMILRIPSHSFLGTSLLKIPEGHALPPIQVEMSKEERLIYEFIKDNIKEHVMRKAAGRGQMTVDWHVAAEAFVRLRQCIASPLLLEALAMEGFWTLADVAQMRKLARDAGAETTPFIDQIKRWVLRYNAAHTPHGSVTPSRAIADAKAVLDAGTCSGYGCDRTIAELVEPHKTECGHLYCKKCFEKQVNIERVISEKDIPECSRCHKPLGQAKPFSPTEPDNESAEPIKHGHSSQRRRGDDYNGKQPRGDNKNSLNGDLDRDPTAKVARSAKVNAVMCQIVDWLNEAPEDKIIGKLIEIHNTSQGNWRLIEYKFSLSGNL